MTLTFDLESGVPVTCDVGYLCANFSLPRPLCSRLRPDVRDRQTDVRQHHRLIPPPRGRAHWAQAQASCRRGTATICLRPAASLTIISCKYETEHFITYFTKTQTRISISRNKHCAILPSLCRHCQSKAKQSKAEYGRRHKSGSISNKLTFNLLTLKVVSDSRVTRANCVPNLVFLSLSVLDLCPMYATDRRQTDRRQTASSLNASALSGLRHNKCFVYNTYVNVMSTVLRWHPALLLK